MPSQSFQNSKTLGRFFERLYVSSINHSPGAYVTYSKGDDGHPHHQDLETLRGCHRVTPAGC